MPNRSETAPQSSIVQYFSRLLNSVALLPHQLEPALAIVSGLGTRVLLADEVGLGKTVQAGLVVAELQARGALTRVLVLTPAGLCAQWAAELGNRFQLCPAVLGMQEVKKRRARLPAGVNPWSTEPLVVASIFTTAGLMRSTMSAKLTEEAGIPFGEISVEHCGVQFPDGDYSVTYEAEDKKSGRFRHVVWFGQTWLSLVVERSEQQPAVGAKHDRGLSFSHKRRNDRPDELARGAFDDNVGKVDQRLDRQDDRRPC